MTREIPWLMRAPRIITLIRFVVVVVNFLKAKIRGAVRVVLLRAVWIIVTVSCPLVNLGRFLVEIIPRVHWLVRGWEVGVLPLVAGLGWLWPKLPGFIVVMVSICRIYIWMGLSIALIILRCHLFHIWVIVVLLVQLRRARLTGRVMHQILRCLAIWRALLTAIGLWRLVVLRGLRFGGEVPQLGIGFHCLATPVSTSLG